MDDVTEQYCGSCGQKGLDPQRCARCKSVWYCNVKCQKKDWKMHKSVCTAQGNKGKGRSTKKDAGESSGRACDLCGKTGTKLFKCGACQSVRYCGSVCQNTDWENHIFDCSVVKLYPEDQFEGFPEAAEGYRTTLMNGNYLSGAITTTCERVTDKLIGKEMDMIVKIQPSMETIDLTNFAIKPVELQVYNESREFHAFVRGSDKNTDFIIEKIFNEGWSSNVHAHPYLKKLYFKAHLNPDFSLDVYLNRTYNIQHW